MYQVLGAVQVLEHLQKGVQGMVQVMASVGLQAWSATFMLRCSCSESAEREEPGFGVSLVPHVCCQSQRQSTMHEGGAQP